MQRVPQVICLVQALADAISHLDEQVIPALGKLLEREQQLGEHLARFQRGELHAPDAGRLKRLRSIHARQREAIDECIQQAANAYATLVALLQEGDDARVVQRARRWADDCEAVRRARDEVLRGEDDLTPSDDGAVPPGSQQKSRPGGRKDRAAPASAATPGN